MQSVAVRVEEMSGVAEARRAAVALARRAGLDEEQSGRVALVATEAATNMLRHADGGEFLAAASPGGGGAALELLALDKGPGIPDVGRAMRDGYSTWGGAGTGLGAIARLASEYQIYTAEGKGAALLARFLPDRDAQADAPLSWAAWRFQTGGAGLRRRLGRAPQRRQHRPYRGRRARARRRRRGRQPPRRGGF